MLEFSSTLTPGLGNISTTFEPSGISISGSKLAFRLLSSNILTASSGTEALKIWKERQPDMIILDIMMPGIDGLSVLREVRETSNIPVLLLTARGEAEDRVAGLEVGADDYLVKPFHPKELLLRVQVILNRTYPQKERKIYLEAAVVDLEKADVQRGENQFPLTGKELTLLEKLAENAGRINNRFLVWSSIWRILAGI